MDPLRELIGGLGPNPLDRGAEARAFVQRLLAGSTGVRFVHDPEQQVHGVHGRTMGHAIAITPRGEINIGAELVRAGYSEYVTSFGTSMFHGEMVKAQWDAWRTKGGRRGGIAGAFDSFAMALGGKGIKYQKPRRGTDGHLTIGTYATDSIDLIDADTVGLGLGGNLRFYNVNAPEMGDWSGVRRQNRVSRDLYLHRLKAISRVANHGWKGVRQSYPNAYNEFHWMKPHKGYGFPAGRAQFWQTARDQLHWGSSIYEMRESLDVEFVNPNAEKWFTRKMGGKIGGGGFLSMEGGKVHSYVLSSQLGTSNIPTRLRIFQAASYRDAVQKVQGKTLTAAQARRMEFGLLAKDLRFASRMDDPTAKRAVAKEIRKKANRLIMHGDLADAGISRHADRFLQLADIAENGYVFTGAEGAMRAPRPVRKSAGGMVYSGPAARRVRSVSWAADLGTSGQTITPPYRERWQLDSSMPPPSVVPKGLRPPAEHPRQGQFNLQDQWKLQPGVPGRGLETIAALPARREHPRQSQFDFRDRWKLQSGVPGRRARPAPAPVARREHPGQVMLPFGKTGIPAQGVVPKGMPARAAQRRQRPLIRTGRRPGRGQPNWVDSYLDYMSGTREPLGYGWHRGFAPENVRLVDVEGQGTTSISSFIDPSSREILRAGRADGESVMVSEIAYGRPDRHLGYKQGVTDSGIHTWIGDPYYEELLEKHGFLDDLDASVRELSRGTSKRYQELARELSPGHEWGEIPAGFPLPGRWDPASPAHDTIPNVELRRLLAEVVESRKPGGGNAALASARDVSRALLRDWMYTSPGKLRTSKDALGVAAWNITYDLPRMFEMMVDSGFEREVDQVIKAGAVQPIELATSLRRMQVQAMMENPEFTPMFSNRAKINLGIGEGVRRVTARSVMKGGEHAGYLREYSQLRELVDDMMGDTREIRTRNFMRRANKAISSLVGHERETARALAMDMAGRFGGATSHDQLMGVLEGYQRDTTTMALDMKWKKGPKGMAGYRTFTPRQILDKMYDTAQDAGHVDLFGDIHTLGLWNAGDNVPFAGIESPFRFVAGSGVEDALEIVGERHRELGVSPDRAAIYQKFLTDERQKNLLERQSHMSFHDREIEAMLAQDVYQIEQNAEYSSVYKQAMMDRNYESGAKIANRHIRDTVGSLPEGHPMLTVADATNAAQSGNIKGARPRSPRLAKGGFKPWMAWTVAGMAALWVGARNQASDEFKSSEIEGLRRPDGEWDGIDGIDPSELPFANLSLYGSGRGGTSDPLSQSPSLGRKPTDDILSEMVTAQGRQTTRRIHAEREVLRGEGSISRPHSSRFGPDEISIEYKAADSPPIPLHPVTGGRSVHTAEQPSPPGTSQQSPAGPTPALWQGLGPRHRTEYRGEAIPKFHRQGMGGVTTTASRPENANLSKVRDHATQMQRLPMMIRTPKGRPKPVISHAEREEHSRQIGAA